MALLEHPIQVRTKAAASRAAAEPQGAGVAADGEAANPISGFWRDTAFLWPLALFSLLLHLATASRFNFYEDELYVIEAARHSLWCCAETFTLQLWLTRLSTAVLGTSQVAVRLLPAVAGSANIVVAGLLARELGGRRLAVSLTGLGVFGSPILLFAATMAGTFSYECLLWTLSALFVVRTLRTGNGRLWWLVGLSWGIAFLAKPPVLLFMLAVGFGLLLTRARVELFRRGYWLALAVAFVISSPVLVWQTVHGWPIIGLAVRVDEYAETGFWLGYYSRIKMLLAQPAFLGPMNIVLAGVGLFYCLACGRGTACRVVLWACAAAGVAFVITSGHPYYPNPMYSMLLGLGCLAAERISEKRERRWLRPALAFGLVLQGLAIVPLCVPILPRGLLDSYSCFVCRGVLAPLSSPPTILMGAGEDKAWAATLHGVYWTLPVDERATCRIILGYAPTAAVAEFCGTQYHLPKIFSPHLNYAFWGPPDEGAGPVIAAYFNRKELEVWFGRVEQAGELGNIPVYICRFPKCSNQKMWQEMCNKDWGFRWRVDRDG